MIQELYGKKSVRPRPNVIDTDDDEITRKNREDDDEELCNDASVDAIVTVKDGTTYTFKVYGKLL